MGYNRLFIFFVSVIVLFSSISVPARADCVNPPGKEAQAIYNSTHKTLQFCDGTTWWSMKGGSGITSTGQDGQIGFYSGNQLIFSSGIFLASSGNVGIGTTTPAQKLHVAGGAIIASSFANRAAGTGPALEIGYDGTKSVLQSYDRTAGDYVPAYFSASSYWFDRGNVGIGTASPGSPLDVQANVGSWAVNINNPHASGTGLAVTGSASGSILRLFGDSGGTEYMRVAGNGNVGIGTANPGTTLDVVGNIRASMDASVNPALNLVHTGTGNATGIMYTAPAGNTFNMVEIRNSSGTREFLVSAAGNVGIGTASPGAKLEVSGNIIASEPTAASHVATKNYVDTNAGGGTLSCTTRTASGNFNDEPFSVTASCVGSEIVTGGGCSITGDSVSSWGPNSNTTYNCSGSIGCCSTETVTAKARCCTVQ